MWQAVWMRQLRPPHGQWFPDRRNVHLPGSHGNRIFHQKCSRHVLDGNRKQFPNNHGNAGKCFLPAWKLVFRWFCLQKHRTESPRYRLPFEVWQICSALVSYGLKKSEYLPHIKEDRLGNRLLRHPVRHHGIRPRW